MGAQDDRVFLAEFLDQLADLYDLLRIKTYRRLIENQSLRIADQSLCKSDSLLISLGQIFNQPVRHIRDTQLLHDPGDLCLAVLARHFLELRCKCQVLPHRHIRIKRRNFRQIPDRALCLLRLIENIIAVYDNLSFSRSEVSGHYVHCGGFACSVRSEETVHGTLIDRKAEVVNGEMITVLFGKILYFNQNDPPSNSTQCLFALCRLLSYFPFRQLRNTVRHGIA